MYIPPSILDHESLKTEVDGLRGYINRIATEALVIFSLNKFSLTSQLNSYNQQRVVISAKEMEKELRMHMIQSIQ